MNDRPNKALNKLYKMLLIGVLMIGFVLLSSPAEAAPLAGGCPEGDSGRPGLSLFSTVIPCVINVIEVNGARLIVAMQAITRPAVNAFLVLAIVIFGILLTAGMLQKVPRDTFVFIIKFAIVVWVTNDLLTIHAAMYSLMQGLVEAVSFTEIGGVRCSGVTLIWGKLDCIVDMVIGIANPQTLANGLLAFFLSATFSGSMGSLIGLLGLYFTVNLVIGAVKAAYIYVLAVLALVLLIMMGSLLVPMIFFKTTFNYFSGWSKMVISSILQPALLFAFLTVVISAMDIIIYTGEKSIYHVIAGTAADSPTFNFATHLSENEIYTEKFRDIFTEDATQNSYNSGNTAAALGDVGLTQGFTVLNPGEAQVDDVRSDANNWVFSFPLPYIDWNRLTNVAGGAAADAAASGDATAAKLFEVASAFIIACLSGFMFVNMMDMIPKIARDLSGGIHSTPALNEAGFLKNNGVMDTVGNYASGMAGRLSNLVGGR